MEKLWKHDNGAGLTDMLKKQAHGIFRSEKRQKPDEPLPFLNWSGVPVTGTGGASADLQYA